MFNTSFPILANFMVFYLFCLLIYIILHMYFTHTKKYKNNTLFCLVSTMQFNKESSTNTDETLLSMAPWFHWVWSGLELTTILNFLFNLYVFILLPMKCILLNNIWYYFAYFSIMFCIYPGNFFYSTLYFWLSFPYVTLLHLFSLLYNIPLYAFTTVYLPIHMLVNLNCVQLFAIANKATMNIFVLVSDVFCTCVTFF